MVGSKNFAPAVISGSGEIPPSTVAETSSGMGEGLALDHASFEKLLEAASVLQCLHDQLHSQEVSRDQVGTGLIEPLDPMGAENADLPATVATVSASKPVPVLEKQATADEAADVKEQP